MAQQSTPAHPATMEAQIEASDDPKDSPVPQPIITTERLLIRPLHPQDASSMALHGNSEAVNRYMTLSFPDPYTLAEAEKWIGMNVSPPLTAFGILEASSPNVVIGGIGLRPGADIYTGTAEVGFWIGEKFWGKGYITEALKAFMQWAFDSFEDKDGQKVRRLFSRVSGENKASLRCFEKCGFQQEGVMKEHTKKNGKIMDEHLFGLTRADWEARQ